MSEMNNIDIITQWISSASPKQMKSVFEKQVQNSLAAKTTEHERSELIKAFESHGRDWGHQPGHPLATMIMEDIAALLIANRGELNGLQHCQGALDLCHTHHVVMVSNHLSYGDVNYFKVLLSLEGLKDFPFLVMAGPKVYQETFRCFSSMAFDTLKMAQPPSRASEGANVPLRELAEITRRVMTDAKKWQERGRILYFFPEGSRSRNGSLQRFLSASARYLEHEKTIVYPVGYRGTEHLIGVNTSEIKAEKIEIGVGQPVEAQKILSKIEGKANEKRRVLMDVLGYAVAELLPQNMRGEYKPEPNEKQEPELSSAWNTYLTEIASR